MIDFTKDSGWKRLEAAIDPRKFDAKIRQHLKRATLLNGKLAQAAVRRAIRTGGFTANAPLTIAIKKSSKPIVDTGSGIFQAISTKVVDDFTVFVGVLRADASYNIAIAIHNGAAISVTPAMRGLFFVLWQASSGAMAPSELSGRAAELWERMPGGWFPLKQSTSTIIIPERPFLKAAFTDDALRQQAQKNWGKALQRAIRDLARQKGG